MRMFLFNYGPDYSGESTRWDVIFASSFKKALKKFMWKNINDSSEWEEFSKAIDKISFDQNHYSELANMVEVAQQYMPFDKIKGAGETDTIRPCFSDYSSLEEERGGRFQMAAFDKIEKDLL